VLFLDGRGRAQGRLVSSLSRAGERRLAWYRLVSDDAQRVAIARRIITGKVKNQRVVLMYRQRRLRDPEIASALSVMRGMLPDIAAVESLERLRGLEGMAARLYFSALGRSITNPLFSFSGRNRRPPRDPVNAMLSMGYTRLVARCEGAALQAGLDVYLGCLHEAGRGAAALSFDLAEEFRPVVDAVVLTLINRRQVTQDDFRHPLPEELGEKAALADEAVYLGRIGAGILIRALEGRLRERGLHPIQGNHWPLGELIVEQARQLARIADGTQEDYQPMLLVG